MINKEKNLIKKKTLIMITSVLIVALFIGTAINPAVANPTALSDDNQETYLKDEKESYTKVYDKILEEIKDAVEEAKEESEDSEPEADDSELISVDQEKELEDDSSSNCPYCDKLKEQEKLLKEENSIKSIYKSDTSSMTLDSLSDAEIIDSIFAKLSQEEKDILAKAMLILAKNGMIVGQSSDTGNYDAYENYMQSIGGLYDISGYTLEPTDYSSGNFYDQYYGSYVPALGSSGLNAYGSSTNELDPNSGDGFCGDVCQRVVNNIVNNLAQKIYNAIKNFSIRDFIENSAQVMKVIIKIVFQAATTTAQWIVAGETTLDDIIRGAAVAFLAGAIIAAASIIAMTITNKLSMFFGTFEIVMDIPGVKQMIGSAIVIATGLTIKFCEWLHEKLAEINTTSSSLGSVPQTTGNSQTTGSSQSTGNSQTTGDSQTAGSSQSTGILGNQIPTARISLSSQNGKKVTVSASGSSDSDGSIIQYKWYYKSLWHTGSKTVSITYLTSGSQTIKVKVKDNNGAWSSAASITIQV